ncbi:MAG: hypothetical protein Q8942_13965 [Bacillota bacterium]|nr:hypothetical protein [Bacillota bacterium]
MDVKPLINYSKPQYPDFDEVKNHPKLLKNIPNRWKSHFISGILISGILLSSLSACGKIESSGDVSHNGKVAPIFIHGNGKSTFNKSVTPSVTVKTLSYQSKRQTRASISELTFRESPKPMLVGNYPGGPVPAITSPYLSEPDVLGIIHEELSQSGINFKIDFEKPFTLKIFNNKDINIDQSLWNEEVRSKLLKDAKISDFDGYDPVKKIGFEYVSVEDSQNLGLAPVANENGDETMDFLDLTQKFRSIIENHTGENYVGLFYDPGNANADIDERKLLLRQQVKDFIEWLKFKGAL